MAANSFTKGDVQSASSSSSPSNLQLPWCQVWLRHGEKSHANGKGVSGYSHDPELTSVGEEQIHQQTTYLLGSFAPPDAIVCSPFVRCCQSAMVMRNTIAMITGVLVPITTDRWIGEYLGNHPHIHLQTAVSPKTLEAKPVIYENLKSFKRKRMPTIIKRHLYSNCWYITHGIIIDHLISHWESQGSTMINPTKSNTAQDPTNQHLEKHRKTGTGGGFTLTMLAGGSKGHQTPTLTTLPLW